MSGRPLTGLKVALSISDSTDSAKRGFSGWQVNHATTGFASALMGQGAAVAFGHDWRDDGVMEAVYGFAQQMQDIFPAVSNAGEKAQPLMYNFLPWPEEPKLDAAEQARLAGTLRIVRADLPGSLTRHAPGILKAKEQEQGIHGYFRARGLTAMRRQMNAFCDARVCVGGRMAGFYGRMPGIVEEAYIAAESEKPLYLTGLFGGAAARLIEAANDGEYTEPPRAGEDLREFYRKPPFEEAYSADLDLAAEKPWDLLKSMGVYGLARANGLSEDENRELFFTPALERAASLILTGLSRIKQLRK